MKRLLILIAFALAGCALPSPKGGERCGGRVFLKTFDAPAGEWLPLADVDDSAVRQFWRQEGGGYLVRHADGLVTFESDLAFRRLMQKDKSGASD